MANSILPIIPIKEEYPKAIRKPMTALELKFEKEAKKLLKPVQDKVIEFARNKTLLLVKNTNDIRDILTTNMFLFDTAIYEELYQQGINYSNDLINRQLNKQGINPINIGINLKLKPEEVRYIDQIQLRRQELAKVLQETTVDETIKTIENGVRDGLSFNDIANNLENNIGISGTRAKRIARTETNWSLNDGQRVNMQRLGITEFTVSYGGNACPLCTSIFQNNKKYPIGQKDILPVHPNCVLGGQEVQAFNVTTKIISHYNGPAVRITTKSGLNIAVTPNHPILTDRGWVFSSKIKTSDYLFTTNLGIKVNPFVKPNCKNINALIDDVVISNSGVSSAMPSTVDFNGDEVFAKNIDIVYSKGFLRNILDSKFIKFIANSNFIFRSIAKFLFNRVSSFNLYFQRLMSSANSIMGLYGIFDILSLRTLRHHKSISFREISQLDRIAEQEPVDNISDNRVSLSKGVFRDSRNIVRDKVVSVSRIKNYHGNVYDLSTNNGWYTVNNIITHNCRCVILSVIPNDWLKVSDEVNQQNEMNKASKIREEEMRLSQKQELSNLEKENLLKEKINQLGEKLQQLEKTIKNVKSDSIEKEQLNKSIESINSEVIKTKTEILDTIKEPKDGYTPIKGKDYFTKEDIEEITKSIKIPTPRIGYSKTEIDSIIQSITDKIPKENKVEIKQITKSIKKGFKKEISFEEIKDLINLFYFIKK